MSAIEAHGLRFGYGGPTDATPVLAGLDLSVPAATLLAVIGPSGCGKTTLLRLLAGFEQAAEGSIHLGGEPVAGPGLHLAPHRRQVGIVPQEGALFPHLDVAANIGFGLPRRDPGRAARVAELVTLAGLSGLESRHPRELSGGQQQRVALARALAPRPRVVLLDEPFAALDPTTRREVRGAVRELLVAEGATAVLVTHDREEALSMADLVAVMVAGVVRQCDTPYAVYDAPHDREVAALLGEVALVPVGSALLAGAELVGVGDAVVLRPEQVVLSPAGLDPTGVAGTVRHSEFLGSATRAVVELDADTDGGTTLVATLVGGHRPADGERVRVAVRGPLARVP